MHEERFDKVPYARRPLCFLDIETTGFEPGFNEITELGFIHEKLGSWCVRVTPRHLERFSEEARKVSGYNDGDWLEAPPFGDIAPRVIEFLENAILVGHNLIGFDMPFIRAEYERLDLSTRSISRAMIDTQILALTHLVPQGLKYLSLKACCSFFDISNAGAHNAYDDALRCKAVYEKIMESLRWMAVDSQGELF